MTGRVLMIALALMLSLSAPAPSIAQPPPKDAPRPATPVTTQLELLMVERDGCVYCDAWKREIMPQYPLTSEGRTAPLRRVQIDGPWPDGIALARRPFITPTFILLQNGKEVGRLEGYAGENYFFPLLDELIAKTGVPLDTSPSKGR